MSNPVKRLGGIVLFLLIGAQAFSQSRLSGKVIQSETGQPIPLASVYLNNTSLGTTTNEKGEFSIPQIPPGKYRLVVSSIGFDTWSQLIDTHSPAQVLNIALKPAADQLKQLQVSPPDPDGWTKWGKLFIQLFIGTNPTSSDCHLLNPEALKFRMNNDNTLTVYAQQPLRLHNSALGYDITYKMEEFEYDLSTKVVVYNGYALFNDLSAAHPQKAAGWRQKRLDTYKGSVLHFMRAFFVNKIEEDGFEMRSLGKVLNVDKIRARQTFNKGRLALDTNSIQVTTILPSLGYVGPPIFNKEAKSTDSTNYFKKALKQPDSIISHQLVPADSIGFAADSVTAGMYFPDSLEISYKLKEVPGYYKQLSRKHRHEPYPISQFVFPRRKPIYILGNGFYYGPEDLRVTGYWAWSETMSTLLPYDYAPATRPQNR
jgi:hypothetical protein